VIDFSGPIQVPTYMLHGEREAIRPEPCLEGITPSGCSEHDDREVSGRYHCATSPGVEEESHTEFRVEPLLNYYPHI